ncbi:hypothetical protein [Methylobacterium sp. CM6246]
MGAFEMTIDWMHAWSTCLAAFLASAVEFVEALTVVLAIGDVRGWRGALTGTAVALVTLLAVVLLFGSLLTRIPLQDVQLAVGGLLLLFGLRWLRKAILRAAGVIPLHDETAAYAREAGRLLSAGPVGGTWDAIAIATTFKITMLEGLEVVFIVIAVGAGGVALLIPASLGAAAALLVVVALGLVLHRPLAMVPENMLKFSVGVLLAAFGTFWVGEGLRLVWPGGDWSILGLTLAYLLVAALAIRLCRHRASADPILATR